jgi:amino acid adenylation domain-containing protein
MIEREDVSIKQKFNLSEKRLALLEKLARQEGLRSYSSSSIPRRNSAGPIPLSFAQERLWFLNQLEPHNSAYNISFALRLTGQLNVIVLEESFGEILRRHEVLRTTFMTDDDRPVQMISPAGDFTLLKIDISDMREEQRKMKVLELANEEASKPFDLTAGPLLRATLLRLGRQEHVLLLTVHHIVSDGWSMGIIYRELSALYEAFLQGDPSPLPDLPIQYADFAVWQRQWLQGQKLERQLSFWKEHLKGAPVLELASDYPRPSVQTFNGALHTLQFPKTLTESLHGLSRKEGVTLFMVLLAAFQTLLHRYTGQSDIVVGTPIANRNHEAIEGLIGFFVNTLVMRIDISGNPGFRELLKRILKNTLGAYAHQDVPFEKLVENLQPERDLGRTPFFQVMFSLQNVPHSALKLSGLTLSPMEIENVMTRFDLEVHLWETKEGLKGEFVYNADLFDASTIERMAGHYLRILERIVVNPEQRLSDLPLLTEEERYQLLVKWNNTGEDYPRDKCIHELFEEQVVRNPDAIAVIFGEKQLTYGQLNSRADQLARYLIKHGVGPEVFVGICVEQSPEMIIGVLGILKAGGAYVPLDPTYPKERLAFILKDTQSPLILTQKRLHSVLPEHAALVIFLDSDLDKIEKGSNTVAVNKTSADNLAYVIYTSGSTGKPKGVCVSHCAVNRLVINTNYIKIDSSDRIAQASSFSFDAVTFELWGALLNGACLVGISRDVILSPEDFSRQISSSGITILFLTTALFNQMARQVPAAFKSLRYLLFGGEAVDPACVRMVVNTGPPQRLLHVYGPTENTTFTSWYPVEDVAADARTIPIGKAVSNTTIYILDRALQPVPLGVPGELYTGGDGLARGYLNQPALNAEKFIPNHFCEVMDTRLYKTGDLARFLPDGSIEFLGRIDHQVKIRGFRIELGEIEAVLGHHPAVREAVVIVREDQPGDKRLVAYIVPEKNSATTINEFQEYLKKSLPDYMVPSVFVHLDTLPLTVNGKLDRKALPSPDTNIDVTARAYVAPRNRLEIQLTEIWEKILGVNPIGVTDNFFDLGGHSLLAVRLTSEIRKITSRDFPVMALFHNQTIEQLAEIIAAKRWSVEWSSVVPIHIGGSKKPLFSVHDTNLTRFLEPDQPFYILTHPSKDENLSPYSTVEKIAAKNLKEMRTIQPRGPYIIGGFCFWAVVALEMVHQLIKQGEKVSLLFLVDPSNIVDARYSFQNTKLEDGDVCHSKKLMPGEGNGNLSLLLRKISQVIKRTINMCRIMIKTAICEMYISMGHPLPEALQSFYFPNYYVTKIMKSYIPKIYPGKAVLFLSDKISPGTEEKWNNLVTGGVEIHEVSGAEHLNILREPYVGQWAQILNTYLEKARKAEDAKTN